jgi:hypothetical protein
MISALFQPIVPLYHAVLVSVFGNGTVYRY